MPCEFCCSEADAVERLSKALDEAASARSAVLFRRAIENGVVTRLTEEAFVKRTITPAQREDLGDAVLFAVCRISPNGLSAEEALAAVYTVLLFWSKPLAERAAIAAEARRARLVVGLVCAEMRMAAIRSELARVDADAAAAPLAGRICA